MSHQKLVEKAKSSGLYDPAQTVASVRRARKGEGEEKSSSSISVEKPTVELQIVDESAPIEMFIDDDVEAHVVFEDTTTSNTYVYALPDDAMILLKIKETIKQFPGNIIVQIGGMDISLSEE